MSPVAAIIITVIVVAILCLCCYLAAKNKGEWVDDDEEYTEVVTETVTVHDGPQGAPGQVYAPGTNPPGTALCNSGHIFSVMYNCPYPDDTATCDNCQGVINW